jgi:hypothetical protein
LKNLDDDDDDDEVDMDITRPWESVRGDIKPLATESLHHYKLK